MGELVSGWELPNDQIWGEEWNVFVLHLDFCIFLEWIVIFDVSFTLPTPETIMLKCADLYY